mmetsp:Transcript_11492/g.16575  ORF Transcript_11492/g.16575 Transcript_11492/m.16575 type:complete len:97 (+) Transcript_11492:133-423(+)
MIMSPPRWSLFFMLTHPFLLRVENQGRTRSTSRDASYEDLLRALEKADRPVEYRKSSRWTETAPSSYKNMAAVMRAQGKLCNVVHTLTPILNIKGE